MTGRLAVNLSAEAQKGAPGEPLLDGLPDYQPQPDDRRKHVDPVPEAIALAFPSITENKIDWREFRPDSLTIAPYPDLLVRFTRTALKDEGRYVTWIGRNPDLPGASLVGVATVGGYDAILSIPGASQFSFHVRGSKVVITESAPGEESCGNAPVQAKEVESRESTGGVLEITYAHGHVPESDRFAEIAPLKVDVLVVYDADTLAAAAAKSTDPVGYIDGQSKAMLETSNLALSQSLVTAFAWRHLGSIPAPAYVRTGKSLDDIVAMIPSGAIGEWIKTTRYQRGADQIVLLIGGAIDFSGRGYSPKQTAVTRDHAVCVMGWGRSYQTLAHELAHNFGCQHDREHVVVNSPGVYGPPAPDGDGFWCYGRMWDNPPFPPGFTGSSGTSGDIMSYAAWKIPYFSNPHISVRVMGSMFGWSTNLDLGLRQIGLAETDPKAAYNVRVLNDQAMAMSGISEEIVVPAITQQPRSRSVGRGLNISLFVLATGGGLAYQWMKDGAPINGATTDSYSKIAEDADAGAYSVTVSNLAGSAISESANISVTAPLPPAPAPATGGGGGAPSVYFLGLLCVCCLARWISASNSCNVGRFPSSGGRK